MGAKVVSIDGGVSCTRFKLVLFQLAIESSEGVLSTSSQPE